MHVPHTHRETGAAIVVACETPSCYHGHMENTVGISKPASNISKGQPPKISKSCTACRLSKTKCVPRLDGPRDGSCERCSRLGLSCIFEPSKRGRQCVSRDKARLGPAVRALLQATAQSDDTAEVAAEMERTKATDDEVLCWCGDKCQRTTVLDIESNDGRLALLRHWLLIGVRSGNCGLLGNILLVAHASGITLDDFALPVARPLQPAPALSLPAFITEWLDSPESLCCARTQMDGVVSWLPNATFVREVGDEAMLSAQLEASYPGISQQVRVSWAARA